MAASPGSDLADWRQAWAFPPFRTVLVVSLLAGVAVVVALPHFFAWIAVRPGMMPPDPVLDRVGPRDVSGITFAVLYGTLVLVLASVARRPLIVLHGLIAYVLVLLLRMAAMACITLEPPPGIIPLVDPVTQWFYPGATPFLKDLFFSGHTATLMLMTLLARRGMVRRLAALGTLAVAALVLVQHVHWTVDVLAAIPAAWAAWKLAAWLLKTLGLLPSAEAA